MISAIIFSRDRPAQLDLLLRSVQLNAPWLEPVTVIFTVTGLDFLEGYSVCAAEHPDVTWVRETDFQAQTIAAVKGGRECTVFLCDDDVVYRSQPPGARDLWQILADDSHMLCVSLRLGINTTFCYSLRSEQAVPFNDDPSQFKSWQWRKAEHDFGYAGSLDGHVFRTDQLLTLITANAPQWRNPNELEDHLHRATQTALLPLMSCYRESLVVGVPVNSVQDVYKPNRHGERFSSPASFLIQPFLAGKRFSLLSIPPAEVRGAHQEFSLLWQGSPGKNAKKIASGSSSSPFQDPGTVSP